jgi:tetratricopeptide (TPR) repeat protein
MRGLQENGEKGTQFTTLLDVFNERVKDYDKTIKLDPKFPKAYDNRGTAKCNLGDYTDAIKDYDKAIKLAPKFALFYFNRGATKLELDDKVGGLKDLKKASALGFKEADAKIKEIQAK